MRVVAIASRSGIAALNVVTAPEELRRVRSGAAVDERSARLVPDAEKAASADFTYVNSGSLEELDAFVQAVLARLQERLQIDA